jgi:hypothetical protein
LKQDNEYLRKQHSQSLLEYQSLHSEYQQLTFLYDQLLQYENHSAVSLPSFSQLQNENKVILHLLVMLKELVLQNDSNIISTSLQNEMHNLSLESVKLQEYLSSDIPSDIQVPFY